MANLRFFLLSLLFPLSLQLPAQETPETPSPKTEREQRAEARKTEKEQRKAGNKRKTKTSAQKTSVEKETVTVTENPENSQVNIDTTKAVTSDEPRIARKRKPKKPSIQDQLVLNDSLLIAEGTLLNTVYPAKKSATKAALLSAVVPGLGQFYGGTQWWMAPVFWGGMFGTMYGYTYYNSYYNDFRKEYKRRVSGQPAEKFPYFDTNSLATKMQQAEQQRDLFLVYTVLVYLLNVIHANVAVQLAEFKLDKKISLQTRAIMMENRQMAYTGGSSQVPGVKIMLNF